MLLSLANWTEHGGGEWWSLSSVKSVSSAASQRAQWIRVACEDCEDCEDGGLVGWWRGGARVG